MPIPSQPNNLIPRPFAAGGNFQVIPDTTSAPGRASYTNGFPVETQRPLAQGGVAPNRLDFNGMYNILSSLLFWQQSGGQWTYLDTLNYTVPCIVYYTDKLWWCVRENGPDSANGIIAPGTNPDYWIEFISALVEESEGSVGGAPNTKQVINTSQTWTAPVDGTYKVTCIGGGGAGGRGGYPFGGGGGAQGGTTSFGSYLSAIGGSGGGGGGNTPDAGAGGGGGAGIIAYDYVKLIEGQIVTLTIGIGAPRTTNVNTGYAAGLNGLGPTAGRGAAGAALGGGGAAGAGTGGTGYNNVGSGGAQGPACGGAGGINGYGYGGGGGGGSGIDGTADVGGAASDGGEYGGPSNASGGGYGGAGGNGAIIIEYYQGE